MTALLFDWLPPVDQLLINSSYLALLVGAFCKSMVRVRVLLILSCGLFMGFGALQGIWPMVLWNIVVGGLHVRRLGTGWWRSVQVSLTAEQDALRRRLLPKLSPGEFQQLWDRGRDHLCVDEILIEGGAVPGRLHLLVKGVVRVERDGMVVDELGPGALFGRLDRSPYLVPNARWAASGAVWLRSWHPDDLAGPGLRAIHRSLLDDVTVGSS